MSQVEKVKKGKTKAKKNSKKKKAKETETEVLERVMGSIEMAGASMDFFEGAAVEETAVTGAMDVEEAESIEALDATEQEITELEAAGEEMVKESEEMEASAEPAYGEDSETMDMLEGEEEMDENSADFIEQRQAYSIIESLLFSSDRPLGMGTFKQVFKGTNYKSKDIKRALEELQGEYADPSRGVTLEEINGGWQLRTKVDNMDFLRRLAKARPFKLSGPALEVLAIIAYKQPIVKSEVDEIRGVESGHLVRALMEKHLVSFQGKSELPGKPMQYGTTRKFLEIFGLRNLRELPSLDEIDQLLPEGIGIEEEDEKLSDVTESMSENYEGNYSEGEEELVKIESTLEGIDTSSEFFEEEKRRQKDKRDRDRARDLREALDVGEEVDGKDVKWLERYDKKLEEEAMAAQAVAEAAEASDDEAEFSMAAKEGRDELSQALDSEESLQVATVSMEMAMDVELGPEDDEMTEEINLSESFEALTDESSEMNHQFDPFEEEDEEDSSF